jgi:amidase
MPVRSCCSVLIWGMALVMLVASNSLPAQSSVKKTTPVSAQALTGEWIFEMDGDAQPQRVTMTLAGDTLRGAVYGQNFAAEVVANRVQFRVGDFRWRGTVRGDSMVGWLGIDPDSSRWTGVRFRAPATPRAYTVNPTTFPRAYSGTAAPVLRIASGDTVHTTTLDAGGWGRGAFGARGNKRSPGGNPLTGPFYVEGAVPGDVLAVTLHRVRLNRDWAFSGTWLVETAIDPSYATERKSPATPPDNKWTLDTVALQGRLTTPSAALRDFTVPLSPFLGVIATAAGTEYAPSSRESGSYGGNMENARLREGTTIYLPVSTMGAHLYLGDGHAAQGSGELTGDAMETSLDVSFTVAIKRWGFAELTRAEDATDIMSMGVAGSLDAAMRRASSDMARWLSTEYGLTASEVALVMGFALQFDIPDVVPPGFGVTARIPKAALRTLVRPTRK